MARSPQSRFLTATRAWVLALLACAGIQAADASAASRAQAVFGGGCFWCIDAAFRAVDGVSAVEAGYAGGTADHPTYQQVCSGDTGHAEVVRVTYDPAKVTYNRLLALFWRMHDPTTVDRQGHDVGRQYRSIILVADAKQRQAAEAAKAEVQRLLGVPVVTEIVDLPATGPAAFHPAEDYHQDYFARHPDQPYCAAVIRPKLDRFLRELARMPAEPR